jgi:hypothetical protein
VPEFLDLAHRYALLITDEAADRERLNRMLLGPPRIRGTSLVDERAGFVPPAWWRGDEYASRSSLAAMMSLKR